MKSTYIKKIITSKQLSNAKEIITKNHKYQVRGYGGARKSTYYEIFHCDDCTLNNFQFLKEIKGSFQKVKVWINEYEFSLEDSKKMDNL